MVSNHFRKCFSVNAGVWLGMENKFSENAFQLTVCWGVKSFPFLFYLQISFSEKQREREREREREEEERAHRRQPRAFAPRTHEPIFNFAGEPRAQITPWTQSLRPRAKASTHRSSTHGLRPTSLRLRRWPRAFAPWTHEPTNQSSTSPANPELRSRHEPRAFDPEPEPSTQSQSLRPTDLRPSAFGRPRAFDFAGNPRTDLSLCVILISVWFWFLLLLWWCGWWCFDGFPVVWWWVLCGWWWKIAFLEYYRTHENIF